MRAWGYKTCLCVLCLVTTPALAQSTAAVGAQTSQKTNDEEARDLFKSGKAAYEAGNYNDALAFFEQSYERSGRAALLYNIGQTADRLRQDDKAIDSFIKYLAQTPPDAPNRSEVKARLQALENARRAREERAATEADRSAANGPTPEQTAEQAPVDPAQSNAIFAEPEPRASTTDAPVTKKWWFWTAIGAVVVAGTATALVLALGNGKTVQDPLYQGGNGVSVQGP